MTPAFSPRWRETFGEPPPERTAQEAAFVARVLPRERFPRLLDVPCGSGRHLRALRALGYEAVGVELDPETAAAAGAVVGDMRELPDLGAFDAVVCLWASFGYFDDATNERVLAGFAAAVRPGGRVLLDVYDPAFFAARQGTSDNRGVRETRSVRDGRLRTELDYGDGVEDVFEWRLYRPDELDALAAACGLSPVLVCAGFDEAAAPRGDAPRMQLVYDRR